MLKRVLRFFRTVNRMNGAMRLVLGMALRKEFASIAGMLLYRRVYFPFLQSNVLYIVAC